jgi:hypothetical protein
MTKAIYELTDDVACRDCKHAQKFDIDAGTHRMMCDLLGQPIVSARAQVRGACGNEAKFFEARNQP